MISANGLFSTSVITSCMSSAPPPEYFIAVIGGRASRTGPVFDGGCPSRICTIEGRGADGAYPGNPKPSSRPEVWLRSARGVTGRSRVKSPVGSFHDVSSVLTSVSSVKRPSCTALSTAMAATGLLMDAAWNNVPVSTLAPVVTSATP